MTRPNGQRQRAAAFALPALFLFLLLLPSTNFHFFSGVPLSSLPEFSLFVLILPVVLSRRLRRLHGRFIGGERSALSRILLCGGLIALAAKLLLFTWGTHEGFLGCYRSPAALPVGRECEKSYENPFFRFGVTRIDRSVDFGAGDWNLSFLNSGRFNFYPWVNGNVSRDRLPILATWRGSIDAPETGRIEVRYVGEGLAMIGSRSIVLPASYREESGIIVPLARGAHPLSVEYKFDDGYRTGDGSVPGPYATFRILDPASTGTAAQPVKLATAWRAIGWLVDVAVIGFALTMLPFYWALAGQRRWIFLVALTCGFGALFAFPGSRWFRTIFVGTLCVLFLGLTLSRKRWRYLPVAYVSMFLLGVARMRSMFPDFRSVLYRAAGGDWLTYESHARSILETWSLEGDEKVFYYQPLFRYIRFAEHFLFGDGDVFVAGFALGALYCSLFFMFAALHPLAHLLKWRGALTVGAGLLLLLTVDWTALEFFRVGASEYPTWIFLSLLFPMLFASRSPHHWLIGALLLGLSILVRTNQAPAAILIFTVFFVTAYRLSPRPVVVAALIFFAVLFLPLLHNVYYGGRAVFLTSSAAIPENLVLRPESLRLVFSDRGIRAFALSQFSGAFYLKSAGSKRQNLAIRGLQLVWGLAALFVIWSWRSVSGTAKLLMLVPLIYLGVHVFYQVAVYYPRHIVIGHLAMGIVAIYSLSPYARTGPFRRG